jgi:hypothetical protein
LKKLKQENELLKSQRDQLQFGNALLKCTTRQLFMEKELNDEKLKTEQRQFKQQIEFALKNVKIKLECQYKSFKSEYKSRIKKI